MLCVCVHVRYVYAARRPIHTAARPIQTAAKAQLHLHQTKPSLALPSQAKHRASAPRKKPRAS